MDKKFMHEIIQTTEKLDVHFELFIDNGSYTPSHWHDSIEIIYITSGNLQVEMGEYNYSLKENDCILINSGVVHSTCCLNNNTSILLQIPLTFLSSYMPDCKSNYFDFNINSNDSNYKENLEKIRNLLNEMKSLAISPSETSHLRFTSLIFEFIYNLYNNFRIPIGSKQKQKSTLSLSRFEPILEYTNSNYNQPISIDKIASIAHLQPEYFCRKFKQYMGQTYLEYLNELRLSYIYKDLITTNDSLTKILEKHGFVNTKLFYKLFKNKFGCTPREIRKTKL